MENPTKATARNICPPCHSLFVEQWKLLYSELSSLKGRVKSTTAKCTTSMGHMQHSQPIKPSNKPGQAINTLGKSTLILAPLFWDVPVDLTRFLVFGGWLVGREQLTCTTFFFKDSKNFTYIHNLY